MSMRLLRGWWYDGNKTHLFYNKKQKTYTFPLPLMTDDDDNDSFRLSLANALALTVLRGGCGGSVSVVGGVSPGSSVTAVPCSSLV